MKLFILTISIFQLFLSQTLAFDSESYAKLIDELTEDAKFLEEYTKWSLELFSQPDYLYGKPRNKFPCSTPKDSKVPTSVHTLTPGDFNCIGAIGDSLTAGLGAHALTPVGLVTENRGVAWSIGGDQTYSKVLSLPNILREYNPALTGYSTKTSVIFLNGQNASNNGLNVAKSGDKSSHMPGQAEILMSRIKDKKLCDWDNDWKLITFFIGGNDLCSFCESLNDSEHTPETYLNNIRKTLDALYNAPLPRTFVNLVLVLDVRGVKTLNEGGFVCETLHKRTCRCAAFPNAAEAKTLAEYIEQYHDELFELVNSSRYDGRDDFTVVIQPFMAKTRIPMKDNNKIDYSYFAPDCFHFSGKGHAQAALSLWNNMLEPVGGKQWFWHMNEELKCPSEQHPYIFTKKNSAKALAEFQSVMISPRTSQASLSPTGSSSKPETTSTKHHKHHESHSDASFSKMQMAAFAGLFLLIIILFVLAITKRQKIRVFVHGSARRRLHGFPNSEYSYDNDDVEVWNRFNVKSNSAVKNELPMTHGSRMSFE